MPASSKRTASQQQQQRQQQQSIPEEDEYDEYVYYPYVPKSVPGGGYEYVKEPQESKAYEQQPAEDYYDQLAQNNSAAPIQRT
jgi:hypothetical protein